MHIADRLSLIPPYLFMELRNKINQARAAGIDVISLGVGDPVEPTPQPVIDELARQANDPANHPYPTDEEKGMMAFRKAVAKYYADRLGARLDPANEIVALIGSKEGCHHFALAVVNPGDKVLVTDPGYPGYRPSIYFAGGEPVAVPMKPENNYLPVLEDIDSADAKAATAFYLNYPNNPTGACATREFLAKLVDFAAQHDIAVCYDNPYAEVVFDGTERLSILSIPGAKDVAVELNSLSKPFNMTGWRIGMACGNADIIGAIAKVKSNTDSGIFNAIQYAGIAALEQCLDNVDRMLDIYTRRRRVVVDALRAIGIDNYTPPPGTFYIWAPTPRGMSSIDFAGLCFDKANVVITPGSAYGVNGEGFFRISLTVNDDRLGEAMERIRKALG